MITLIEDWVKKNSKYVQLRMKTREFTNSDISLFVENKVMLFPVIPKYAFLVITRIGGDNVSFMVTDENVIKHTLFSFSDESYDNGYVFSGVIHNTVFYLDTVIAIGFSKDIDTEKLSLIDHLKIINNILFNHYISYPGFEPYLLDVLDHVSSKHIKSFIMDYMPKSNYYDCVKSYGVRIIDDPLKYLTISDISINYVPKKLEVCEKTVIDGYITKIDDDIYKIEGMSGRLYIQSILASRYLQDITKNDKSVVIQREFNQRFGKWQCIIPKDFQIMRLDTALL